MRIRRRPPQIPAPASSDLAAGGGSSGGGSAGEAAAGGVVGKGEILMGTGGLHPPIESRGKGGRPWGGESVNWKPWQPEGGARGGSRTSGSSDASCHGEVQRQKQAQGVAEEGGDRGAEEELKEDQKLGEATPPVGAHKTWNHVGAGGSAAANGLGAEAFVSAAEASTGSHCELGNAARKRKNLAWSSGSSRSARSPSSSSSSLKTEISNGEGITSFMQGGDHPLVKDEDEKKGEEVQQQMHVNAGGVTGSNNKNSNNNGKRRRSPAVLMEGSRCSRVNGRGWRCCQQTLVGYSLCEHHLGKGRLRSVSSVRCKKTGASAAGVQLPNQQGSALPQLHDKPRRNLPAASVDDDEWKPDVEARRGKRIGVVKARSISSLLGQTSSDLVGHAHDTHEAVAPKIAPTMTSAALPAAVTRSPVESSTSPAAVAVSLPPPTAAHQEGISAVM